MLKVIVHLLRSLDSICTPAARSVVVWMMGEYSNVGVVLAKMLPILFSYLASRFTLEAVETKLQIINACVKVVNISVFTIEKKHSSFICLWVGRKPFNFVFFYISAVVNAIVVGNLV